MKNILSVIFAIIVAFIALKLIGFAFMIAFQLMKIVILVIIAIPAYFVIKKLLGK